MSVSVKELEIKLRELHPEIRKHGLTLSLSFDKDKDAWVVGLWKGDHSLTTYLDAKDAASCIEGVQCIYLDLQVSQFIKNFEAC
ncbi:MAG: hypothetical protein HQK60_12640 [Deltaproteobacteria bacterium]|nr:hypothetical protein [Deltaproteobacteria bacterium]